MKNCCNTEEKTVKEDGTESGNFTPGRKFWVKFRPEEVTGTPVRERVGSRRPGRSGCVVKDHTRHCKHLQKKDRVTDGVSFEF